ncbi:glycoside hydrolase family 65 protein [Caulobacter sp. DWP3-1-3b2]|uniref:glycoside hydrolase family 65 protein n=1 Tax=Caulobacter sp. DWP3-1-3b2 TaxID=2804643 RepID=UPI003CF6AB69
MTDPFAPTADPTWLWTEAGCDPLRQSSRETRLAISNGFLGVRGAPALNRGGGRVAPSRTYVAGLFDTASAQGSVSALAPGPDWLRVQLATAAGLLAHDPEAISEHSMTLDMRRGLVSSDCHSVEARGLRLGVRSLRLVSLSQRQIGLQGLRLRVDDGESDLTLEADFEGLDLGLIPETLERDLGVWRTRRSAKRLAIASTASVLIDGETLAGEVLSPFHRRWTWKASPGQQIDFERIVAFVRTDAADLDVDVVKAAPSILARAVRRGFAGLIADHAAAWAERWTSSDVQIDGDPAAQQALRFALHHLNGAADPEDEHVSIGARALTGEDYLGHTFWDTEIFLLPFYTFTWPSAARALLMYRFHTLEGARAKAAAMGWRGALYAWESADTGAETTPDQWVGPDRQVLDILTGEQEQHISADVAYAVWQYWRTTDDEAFLREAGAEILLETARFWASRAAPDTDGVHHIRRVIGPDEYHVGVDDNAYTNLMARWNIRRALEVAACFSARWPAAWTALSGRLGLTRVEMTDWSRVAETMATGEDLATGLTAQFKGFLDLEDIDLAAYAGRSVPMDTVLGRDRTARSQVIKQADVVALLALLPDEFTPQATRANFAYYEARCGHGSSLSRALHGLVAARLGQLDKALSYLLQSSAIDLGDTHVAIAGGIHTAAQGGVWMIAVLGLAGLSLRDDGLSLEPRLPDAWLSLTFPVQWRGRQVRIKIDRRTCRLEATLESGGAMVLWVEGERYDLGLGRPVIAELIPLASDPRQAP